MSRLRSIIRRLFVLGTLLCGVSVDAQTAMDESQIKARFVYNFLKFVEWPADTTLRSRDPFVVLIIGQGATADATASFLEARSIGDRPVVVRRVRWNQSLVGAQAAFVVERDAKKLHRVLDAAAVAGVLTIGEGKNSPTTAA